MRSFMYSAAVLPALALACTNPETHECAAAFVDNADLANSFCETYLGDDTAAAPTEFSACGTRPMHLSSACSCYATATAAASTVADSATGNACPSVATVTTTIYTTPGLSTEAYTTPAYTTPAYTTPAFTTPAYTTLVTSVRVATSVSSPAADTSVETTPVETPTPTSTPAATTAAAVAGTGGTSLATVTGGSGVGGTTCTVTDFADITASVSACSNVLVSNVNVPASTTLSVSIPSGNAFLFAGTMTVEYAPDPDFTPFVFEGSNAKIAGVDGAVIDGQGALYWDGEGSNGGSDKINHFFKIRDMESSSLSDLTFLNWPVHLFSVDGATDFTMSNLILDNSAGNEEDDDGDALGHNTDAIDVSRVDGLYVHDVTVLNQDDCVAINSGSNMVFENMYCDGSHGLSVGSIDSDVTVSNVTFKDSTVINAANGCRIKTKADSSDSTVSGITYSNIYVSNISDYAIDIQQDYENGSPTGDPSTDITVSDVTFENIVGDVADDDAYSYYILCGSTDSCSDITFSGIDISGGSTECSPSSLCSSL